jgi:Bacterial transcriptional activator domain
MPLVKATLKAQLLLVMNSYPDSVAQAAAGFAAAYAAYAGPALFTAAPITLTTQKNALEATLLAAMQQLGEAEVYAGAWRDGLSAFWVGVPVGPPNPGATIGCPGASAAYNTILMSLKALPPTIDQAAEDLANALATATATVTANVTLPGPPPTPAVLPIS